MDLINSTVVPFTLMIIISSMLIYFIVKSKKRMKIINSSTNNRDYKKISRDVLFSITIISLIVVFLIMYLPCDIIDFLPNSFNYGSIVVVSSVVMYYTYFGLDFFAYFCSNSMFREELFYLLRIKKQQVNGQSTNMSKTKALRTWIIL